MQVIPNLADRRFFENGCHAPPQNGRFRFISVCLLDHKKGMDVLLAAFAEVRKKHSEAMLTICGDGEEMENLRAQAKALALDGAVEFAGSCSREECARRLKDSQAFVLPSRYETFGIVFVEAMGCGLPIIMTKTGAWKTLVRPETGLAVETEDPAGLAYAMGTMIERYDDYDPEAIRRFCRNNFSENAVCEQLTAEYKRHICR